MHLASFNHYLSFPFFIYNELKINFKIIKRVLKHFKIKGESKT